MAPILWSILLVLIVIYLIRYYLNNKDLPPGPWGVPILGYLPFFKPEDVDEAVKKISSKYGTLFSVKFGPKLVVFICDYETMKEAFVKEADSFAGRPKDLYMMTFSNKNRGVTLNEGEEWKLLRRYSASSMRDFGMGKLSLQGKVHEELYHLYEYLAHDQCETKPFNPRSMFSYAVINVFCNMMCGHRFQYSDSDFRRFTDSIYVVLTEGYVKFLTWFPIFRFVPPFRKMMNEIWEHTYFAWDFMSGMINDAEKAVARGDEPVSFLQAIVKEAKTSEADRSFILNRNMLYNTAQLFIGGGETITTSLEWACFWLMVYPDMQRRIQEEIDANINPENLPSLEDKSKLPFTDAFCLELLRMCPVLPLGIPHATTREIWFKGYRIPERTIVFSHLSGIMKDPKYFDEPNRFKPERFIDADGKIDSRKASYVPFSIGRRQCIGESLARMELFCVLAVTLQNYTIVSPSNQRVEAPERLICGITAHPPDYEMLLKPRYSDKTVFNKRFEGAY